MNHPIPVQSNALFLGTYADKDYLLHIKHMFSGVTTYTVCEPVKLLTQLELYCQKRSITRVVSTNIDILLKLLALEGNVKTSASLADYAGSLFTYRGIEIVFIDPLAQLVTVSYGRFITQRNISKVINPLSWPEATEFKWAILTPENIQSIYEEFHQAFAIAVDLETVRQNTAIRCSGYTALFIDRTGRNPIRTLSVVLPIDSDWAVTWMRKFNNLSPAKVLANGKYDCSYLLRFNAPVTNWLWDVQHLFHSWYSELPKDLAFLNAFFLRKVVYWKDLAETTDIEQYYRYNALDTWATINVWVQQILQAPAWAKRNYLLEFPLVYPCLLAEMTGLRRDMGKLVEARKDVDAKESETLTSLRRMIDVPGFNPGSHVQVKSLMKVLGCADIADSSGEKNLNKASYRHPLNARIFTKILDIRGWRKLATTYLRLDSDKEGSKDNGSKEYHGRILYALNPHGTDTGRLASREHHFWTGLQIQNIPRGVEVKQTICADDGFYLGECDLEQAESRDTANIAGDTSLIAAVSGSRDFHSVNCSAFFGVPYESIYDDALGKTLNKALRDVAKRVNHGANYNMGAGTLVDTMGLENIFKARTLLGLKESDPKKIATYLLAQFHRTYPSIAGKYYVSVVNEIGTTSRLTSRAYHHTEYNKAHFTADDYIGQGDWVRYCFGKPDKNKLDLNSYVAHCPQSLNARTLNEAFLKVFYEIALPNPEHFRLHAQIHDSILFSYTEEGLRKNLPDQVREAMEIPVTIRDVSGTYREFTVPAALKLGKTGKDGTFKRAKYWSETE